MNSIQQRTRRIRCSISVAVVRFRAARFWLLGPRLFLALGVLIWRLPRGLRPFVCVRLVRRLRLREATAQTTQHSHEHLITPHFPTHMIARTVFLDHSTRRWPISGRAMSSPPTIPANSQQQTYRYRVRTPFLSPGSTGLWIKLGLLGYQTIDTVHMVPVVEMARKGH